MTAEDEKKLEAQAEAIAIAAVKPMTEKEIRELSDEELVKQLATTVLTEKKEKERKRTMKEEKKVKSSPAPIAKKTKKASEAKVAPAKEKTPAISITVLTAFRNWRDKKVYIDGQGNYHLKAAGKEKGPNADWNKTVKKAYPTFADFMTAYKKASKRGLLTKPLTKAKETPKAKAKDKKEIGVLLRRRPIKESVEAKDIVTDKIVRLIRRNVEDKIVNRNLPEASYVKGVPVDADAKYAIGKSISYDTMRTLYETGLKAIQDHIVNVCPKIYIVDILLPRHRVPKSRYLIEDVSPERALTKLRNENEKRIKAKKRAFFGEDDVIKLLVPAFESSIMEV